MGIDCLLKGIDKLAVGVGKPADVVCVPVSYSCTAQVPVALPAVALV